AGEPVAPLGLGWALAAPRPAPRPPRPPPAKRPPPRARPVGAVVGSVLAMRVVGFVVGSVDAVCVEGLVEGSVDGRVPGKLAPPAPRPPAGVGRRSQITRYRPASLRAGNSRSVAPEMSRIFKVTFCAV